ncbi:MAG: ORF6N domain-containing protein [Prevotellaceae bacterium]|jgi:hypothetical protein|nr:ORF6N domain-containing protein [Prevotellaceae bacterium]
MEQELVYIQKKIYEIRGQRIMLDFDLAEMYQVETKNLNLSVKRNIKRFPSDFMFQLTDAEWDSLRLQIETSKRGGRRYLPYAFTEQGIAMLSGLLNSDTAIEMNIRIMRAFVFIRQYALGYVELNRKLEDFMQSTNIQFNEIYQALTELAEQKRIADKPRKPIGYLTEKQRKELENSD